MRINSYSLHLSSAYESAQSSLTRVTQKGEMIHTLSQNLDEQKLSLAAQGMVQTLEGGIDVALSTSLFYKERYTVERLVHQSAIDPLVLNLHGSLADVEMGKTFFFDLNNDGKKEAMALLKEGNGFLALDANANGIIDNGSELFGTKSGDGFADLAVYDEDKNGVIDENDVVFTKLRIWQKSALNDELISLSSAHVGALLLDNVASLFHYQEEGLKHASVQKSGVALFEDGRAGWMSHVDFYVNEEVTSRETPQNMPAPVSFPLQKTSSTTSNTHEALIGMLEKRLHILETKLSKTHHKEQKQALHLQILTLSQQIALLEIG
jgi:hypothetical protein